MTLHAAKGLEFELVFLPALEEGILPFAGAEILAGKEKSRMDTDGEEERRLFYVGLTRARQGVYLSSSGERTLFGRTMHLLPSSLLKELPGDRINRIKATAHIRKTEKQLTLF
jgi:superfamily I DNA/RNA helicase